MKGHEVKHKEKNRVTGGGTEPTRSTESSRTREGERKKEID